MPDPSGPEYLPTPAEIRERRAMCDWLREHGFIDPMWGCCIMIYESPSFELVQRMVRRYGEDEARERLRDFL